MLQVEDVDAVIRRLAQLQVPKVAEQQMMIMRVLCCKPGVQVQLHVAIVRGIPGRGVAGLFHGPPTSFHGGEVRRARTLCRESPHHSDCPCLWIPGPGSGQKLRPHPELGTTPQHQLRVRATWSFQAIIHSWHDEFRMYLMPIYPRLAVALCLCGSPEGAIAVLGVECSTFVSINKGTNRRDAVNPWGNIAAPSVASANKSTSRYLGGHAS